MSTHASAPRRLGPNPTRPTSIEPAPAAAAMPLGDLRFRALLPAQDWQMLPQAVRTRFSKRVADGATVVYTGTVEEVRFSRLGRLLAEACRVIGGPLPVSADVGCASVVSVTEDVRHGGQVWTRLYARRTGMPQIIHSTKRFEGATGLEEHIGCGIGISLRVRVTADALVFEGRGYFLALGRYRLHLPRWLLPFQLTVEHAERGNGRFAFTLALTHMRLGELLYQRVGFRDGIGDAAAPTP